MRLVLTLTSATLATVDELFEFKAQGFELPPFPGYTTDQWGIKAHNRPWIAATGRWKKGQRIAEVGGAYSRLPEWLGERHDLEPWVVDSFGEDDDPMWSRWGDPRGLPEKFPSVTYVFENMGASTIPDRHFDCIFTVSTLEHIPLPHRLPALRDMNRCTAPGGTQLHTIDVWSPGTAARALALGTADRMRLRKLAARGSRSGISAWINAFAASGVRIGTSVPSTLDLVDRRVLVESPDVWYRFVPPNDAPKPYTPPASLLLVIEDL